METKDEIKTGESIQKANGTKKKKDCLSDLNLFPKNEEEFIENFIKYEISHYISMHAKAIKNITTK